MTVPQAAEPFSDSNPALPPRRERRPVTLAGYATREDGALVELTVVDLSYDGCGVICTHRLTAGERLSLSVLDRGCVPVTVRWADGGRAGLSFAPVTADDQPARQPRRHERVSVEGEVTMHRRSKVSYRVHIFDLSPEGCRAEFVERPELHEQLWVKFDGLEHIAADVRWITGTKAGLKFMRAFHPAVFDLLLARLKGDS
jgi:hypothetical protein